MVVRVHGVDVVWVRFPAARPTKCNSVNRPNCVAGGVGRTADATNNITFHMERYGELEKEHAFKAPEQASRFKERLKEAVLKLAAVSIMFGSHMTGYAQARSMETRPRVVPNAEKLEKERTTYNPKDIREGLRTDAKERIFISTDQDPQDELEELSGGGVSSGYLSYEEISRRLSDRQERVTELKVTHTHPLAAYRNVFLNSGVGEKDQLDYKRGKKQIPPHPPSMADFMSQRGLQEYFEDREITVTSEVLDSSGSWTYTVDSNSKLLRDLESMQEEYSQELDKNLSDKQWSLMTGALASGNVDPRLLAPYLNSRTERDDPKGEYRQIGRMLLEMEKSLSAKYKQATDLYHEIETKGAKVVTAKSEEGRKVAIDEYIQLCRANGIEVTRTY